MTAAIRLITSIILFGTFGPFSIDRAFSDVVIPSDRVSVAVNVRETPNANSLILDVLTPGEHSNTSALSLDGTKYSLMMVGTVSLVSPGQSFNQVVRPQALL
jgi:hypothetical protein